MGKINEARVPYNYIDLIYFNPLNFNIQKGIDYLTLSVHVGKFTSRSYQEETIIKYQKAFHVFLISNGYWRIKHSILQDKQSKHSFKDAYIRSSNGNQIEIMYDPKSMFIPFLQIKIHDPDQSVVNTFNSFLQENDIRVGLTDLEIRFDFYTDHPYRTWEFLNRYLFIKRQRSRSNIFKSTFYTNNLRKDSKGMRVYFKKEKKCVRMEIRLRSVILKRMNVMFPLENLDELDLSRFFAFMDIDFEKLFDYLKWQSRGQFEKIAEKDSRSRGILLQTIRSWMRSIIADGDGEYLMKGIEVLKSKVNGVPNHSRFLIPMEAFNEEFNRQVSGQKFLQ